MTDKDEGEAVANSDAGGEKDMAVVVGLPDPPPVGKVGSMVGGGTGLVKQGTSLVICWVLFGEL